MKKHYVAVKIDGEVSVHMPHSSGNYYTLCGIDGDDPHEFVNQEVANVPNGAKIDCLDCFQLWDVSRSFELDDFCEKKS